jgi:hypothetical protein
MEQGSRVKMGRGPKADEEGKESRTKNIGGKKGIYIKNQLRYWERSP